MSQGKKISTEQVEVLRQVYAETGNISDAARSAGIARSAASRYLTKVLPAQGDDLDGLRRDKTAEVIERIHEVRHEKGWSNQAHHCRSRGSSNGRACD